MSKENNFMQWFLYIFGLLYIAYGGCAILYTYEVRQGLRLFFEKTNLRILAALPVAVGLLLIISAAWSDHGWFIRMIGLVAIAKGVLIYVNPDQLWSRLTEWFLDGMDDKTHRFLGIICVIFGTAVVSWIR
jgi:uncharacterized protein YjeT (DUF2065 family)